MHTPVLLITLATWFVASPGAAQDPAAPVSDAVRSAAARARTTFIAAAEEMPSGKYRFKPTAAQMSFGDVIGHIGAGNDALCSSIGGVSPPKRSAVSAGAPKEKLVTRLRETFQFCESALAKEPAICPPEVFESGPHLSVRQERMKRQSKDRSSAKALVTSSQDGPAAAARMRS